MHRATIIVCAIAALTSAAHAQLTPPPGPVEPTMKTLDEIEPSTPIGPDTTPGDESATYIISDGGHYHLTGDLNADKEVAILITNAPVTIDLRGFTVATEFKGIVSTSSLGHTTVRNGDVWIFGLEVAIDLESGSHAVVEHVRTYHGSPGIKTGPHAIVRRCMLNKMPDLGITVGKGSLIDACTLEGLSNNDSSGVVTAAGCVVRDTTVSRFGVFGIAAGQGTRVVDCTARDCTFSGFQGVDGSSFTGCIAQANLGYGFFFMSSVRAKDCSAEGNDQSGFALYQDCVLTDSLASRNAKHGIELSGNNNRINANTVVDNAVNGIYVPSIRNVITLNTVRGHGHKFSNINVAGGHAENYFGGYTEVTGDFYPLGNFCVDE